MNYYLYDQVGIFSGYSLTGGYKYCTRVHEVPPPSSVLIKHCTSDCNQGGGESRNIVLESNRSRETQRKYLCEKKYLPQGEILCRDHWCAIEDLEVSLTE